MKAISDMSDVCPDPGDTRTHLSSWIGTEMHHGAPETAVVIDAVCKPELQLSEESLQSGLEAERMSFVANKLMAPVAKTVSKGKERQAKLEKKAMNRRLHKKLLSTWRKKMRKDLSKFSRAQLLTALIPEAGKGKKSGKKCETKKKAEV